MSDKVRITVLVENQPGALARIVGLISGRGYNIETLNVGPTLDPTVSKVTLVIPGDDRVLAQVTCQLGKLIEVIEVTDVTGQRHLDRELVLVEIASGPKNRAQIMEIATLYACKIICVRPRSLTLQMCGDSTEAQDFLNLLRPFKILNIARSGAIAIARGA